MPSLLLLSLLSLASAQEAAPEAPPAPSPELALPASWPAAGALVLPEAEGGIPALPGPPPARPLRVALDPGHGVRGDTTEVTNPGMDTADCTSEHVFTLDLARDLGRRLEGTGAFEVILLREAAAGPAYPDRWEAAEAAGAEVFLSLHSDSRGEASMVELEGRRCPQRAQEPGFSVLFSMEGDETMDARRGELARALSATLRGIGLPAYDGADYGTAYTADPVPGVFIDGRGLAMLRRPPMPSVIVETHHAWHPEEWARWQEEETRLAFAAATAEALLHWAREHRAGP